MGTRIAVVRTGEGVAFRLSDERFLAVRQILGIGRNYAEHATEQGADVPERPMVFCKNVNAASLHDEPIVIPPICRELEQVDELLLLEVGDAQQVLRRDRRGEHRGHGASSAIGSRGSPAKRSAG